MRGGVGLATKHLRQYGYEREIDHKVEPLDDLAERAEKHGAPAPRGFGALLRGGRGMGGL